MRIELEFISDITSSKNGKTVLISRNDKVKKLFNLDEVELEEYIDPKTGKHIPKYTTLSVKETYYKINKPYEELKALTLNRTTPVLGFAAKSKKWKS